MSDMNSNEHNAQPEQEKESLPYGKVVLVGVFAVALFTVSFIWVIRIQSGIERESMPQGRAAIPSQIGLLEINIINQAQFAQDHRAADRQSESRKTLSTYGWVNRGKNVIHIPVSNAMETYLKTQGAGEK